MSLAAPMRVWLALGTLGVSAIAFVAVTAPSQEALTEPPADVQDDVRTTISFGPQGPDGPKKKTVEVDLTKPFSHGSHFKEFRAAGDKLLGCADCHSMSATTSDGYPICKTPRMPFPRHETCTPCHKAAFFTQPLQICGNCHKSNEFFKKPPLKLQGGRFAPLKPKFNHKLHLDPNERVKKRFKFKKDCTFCHSFSRGGEKVNLPAHPQCCDCHTREGVEPNMNNCAGCHARPKSDRVRPSKIRKFSHADHTLDPRTGQSLECMRCHFAVPRAQKVRQIDMPVMKTCVDCHSGEVAFDYAQCLKCHSKDITKKPVPASHKAGAARRNGQ